MTLAYPHLGDYKTTGRSEIRFNCPFCIHRVGKVDTKFHLYVDLEREHEGIIGWYRCFRCGAAGPSQRLLGHGALGAYKPSKWQEFVQSLRGGKNIIDEQGPRLALPLDFNEIIEETSAYHYLCLRDISDKKIKKYRIGFGTQNLKDVSAEQRKFYAGSGRIVFPDYDLAGEIVYWVARTYRNHQLRYKNPPESNARDKIYNLAMASSYEEVVVCEGVISAIAAGYNAVATYGKGVTDLQVALLSSMQWKRYIIALDGDATRDAMKLAEHLSRRGHEVALVRFKYGEDPASVDDIAERIEDAVPYDLKHRLSFVMK